MFSTPDITSDSSAQPPPGDMGEDQAALTLARLAELDRLRNFSFAQAERLMELPQVLPVEEARRMFGKKGTIQQFDRITRAFRQIVVLEYELRGLFNAPDRDAIRPLRLARPPKDPFKVEDLHKLLADLHGKESLSSLKTRTDYRTGPIEDVVAGIRKVLGAEPPQNDPFAPRKDRPARPVQTAPVQTAPVRNIRRMTLHSSVLLRLRLSP